MKCKARMFMGMMMMTTILMIMTMRMTTRRVTTMRMMRMRMRKVFCAGCSGQLSFAPNTIVSAGAVAIVPAVPAPNTIVPKLK